MYQCRDPLFIFHVELVHVTFGHTFAGDEDPTKDSVEQGLYQIQQDRCRLQELQLGDEPIRKGSLAVTDLNFATMGFIHQTRATCIRSKLGDIAEKPEETTRKKGICHFHEGRTR